jgi:hypothetical protein
MIFSQFFDAASNYVLVFDSYDLSPEIPAFELLVVLCTYAVLFRANACYVRGSFLLVLHRFPSVL